MPQISKIRIVNFNYNDGNRFIPDELYDLASPDTGKALNTLFNLNNGGGKTVLVQLMMQPVHPKAMAGGRRIEDYFSHTGDHSYALNVTNSNEKVQVGDAEMSIDTILIKMAQLNKRKSVLDQMRKQLPKAREEQRSYMSRNTVPEYRYINYDLELIKKEYEAVSKTIMEMQMALDKYNQTVQFEVDI